MNKQIAESFHNFPMSAHDNADIAKDPDTTYRIVAIGNFDGAHRGHAALVTAARALAAEAALARQAGLLAEILAMTFDPHPRQLFQPDQPMFQLTPGAMRDEALAAIGFDGAVVVAFDRAFAGLSAEAFIEEVLVKRLQVDAVVVGEDFHFGKGRQGTPDMLVAAGQAHGFAVRLVPPVRHRDGTVVSSTAIRDALAAGDIVRATALLGRPYAVAGEVIHGAKRGRELGYRTANIALHPGNRLAYGVYAVTARLAGRRIDGVASYGRRPQFDNGAPLLEVHLFDFAEEIYGSVLTVAFHARLRGEAKFDSLDALLVQMARDCEEARAILAGVPEVLPQITKA